MLALLRLTGSLFCQFFHRTLLLDVNPAGKGENGDALLEDGCPLEKGPKEAREKRPWYRWSWKRSGGQRKDPAALGST